MQLLRSRNCNFPSSVQIITPATGSICSVLGAAAGRAAFPRGFPGEAFADAQRDR